MLHHDWCFIVFLFRFCALTFVGWLIVEPQRMFMLMFGGGFRRCQLGRTAGLLLSHDAVWMAEN